MATDTRHPGTRTRFIGTMSPIVAIAVAGAVGSAAFAVLDSAGWVGSDPTRTGLARSTMLAIGLGVAIAIADSVLGFGENIDMAWPASLLVVVSRRWSHRNPGRSAVMVPIMGVALLEAVYQILGSSSGGLSRWLLAYLGIHLTAFAAAGLTALRRYGFGAMRWLRLTYYAAWHVAWGVLRLDLLF